MTANLIIEKNILTLKQTRHNNNNFSQMLVHNLMGKVLMAVELQALSWEDAEKYIDILLSMLDEFKP